MQAELAAALLEEEWPDEREAAAARAAAREAATPVPERVWALRNVGATLALGGPGERARARQMLEKAALLKAEWVGGKRHPGLHFLPCAWRHPESISRQILLFVWVVSSGIAR
jgi:hypothetical protein